MSEYQSNPKGSTLNHSINFVSVALIGDKLTSKTVIAYDLLTKTAAKIITPDQHLYPTLGVLVSSTLEQLWPYV